VTRFPGTPEAPGATETRVKSCMEIAKGGGSCWKFWISACKISFFFWNFGQCIFVCLCYLFSMATDDMDTSGPSTEGSLPQVSPVVTSSHPSDEGLRNLVAQTIQEYCHGKLIDDHSQF
jgi:hypothetical protein